MIKKGGNSEQGNHLYIISLAADGTAVLLYPNRLLPDAKLVDSNFEFPPLPMRRSGQFLLQLFPLNYRDTRESIKVVVSRKPLDFSFLPQPENQLLTGAKGGDIKRMIQVLKTAKQWNEKLLTYWVGPGCK